MTNMPRPSTCKTCGGAIEQAEKGRPRLYCSDKCRHAKYDKARLKGCNVEGCDRRPTVRGYCPMHYAAAKRRGEFPDAGCSVEGCNRSHYGHGLCVLHWRHARQDGAIPASPCSVDGCDCASWTRGLCGMHAYRERRYGDPGEAARRRNKTGEGHKNARTGYIDIQVDNRKLGQHRWVMEQALGRELLPGENVHHRNGIRDDNRPDNLELWLEQQPSGQRVVDLIAFVVEHYREAVAAAMRGDTQLKL